MDHQGGTAQVRFQPRHGRYLAAAAENIVSILDVETQACRHSLQVFFHSLYYLLCICILIITSLINCNDRDIQNQFIPFAGTRKASIWRLLVRTRSEFGPLCLETKGSVSMTLAAMETSFILAFFILLSHLYWSLAVTRLAFVIVN